MAHEEQSTGTSLTLTNATSFRLNDWLFEEDTQSDFNAEIVRLHGKLASITQDSVIRSGVTSSRPPLRRRVILATPIAESSLTIEGIGVVVDCGLRKSPVFDARKGLNLVILLILMQPWLI